MLRQADLPDEAILECIRAHYGIAARELRFLPLGNDASSWAYRIYSPSEDYFLKLRRGTPPLVGLLAPHHLRQTGLPNVVAPLPNRTGPLFTPIDEFSLALYPWICGTSGWGQTLSEHQLRQWGCIARAIHDSPVSASLEDLIHKEEYGTKWLGRIGDVEHVIARGRFSSGVAGRMGQVWREKAAEIRQALHRYQELAQRFAAHSPESVLCHADLHAANIIIAESGDIYIVDWDEAIIAPKERDLMFFVGDGQSSAETAAILEGYGDCQIDLVGLAYYRYDWVMQEFCDYGERILLNPGLSAADQSFAYQEFCKLFAAGDVIERADRAYNAIA